MFVLADRIAQLTTEAQNRTSVSLTRLHKVPVPEHEAVVTNFFAALRRTVESGAVEGELDDIVRDFFTNLFPAVFNFVLSVQGQGQWQLGVCVGCVCVCVCVWGGFRVVYIYDLCLCLCVCVRVCARAHV